MKKFVIITLLSMGFASFSQTDSSSSRKYRQETLFNTNKGFGAYIGINSKFTQINNSPAILTGGELDFVIGHKFNFGFEGYGSVNPVKSNRNWNDSTKSYLNVGYGGFHLEPVLFSDKLVHVTFPTHLGIGAIAETRYSYLSEDYHDNEFKDDDLIATDLFFVAEPSAMVEVNVFRFMRLGAGLGYRFTSGVDLPEHQNSDFDGLTGTFSLRLGWF
jgi:hypothetical protein